VIGRFGTVLQFVRYLPLALERFARVGYICPPSLRLAHLAAAMGKPVWLLNRFAGCGRWLRDRDDSPWYASVRLFTQTRRGDWNGVLERVAEALRQASASSRGKSYRAFVR
jgi:hypothetical protein